MDKLFDLVIKNARVVRPNKTSIDCLDIAIKDGKIEQLAPDIQPGQTKEVFDAKNRLAFPGVVVAGFPHQRAVNPALSNPTLTARNPSHRYPSPSDPGPGLAPSVWG